jgi:hypothetical protein
MQDTVNRGAKEKKVSKRVPKSGKESPKEESKSDNGGFLSSCLSSIDWFSCLFGTGENEEEEKPAIPGVVELPPTAEIIDTSRKPRELPPIDYGPKDSVLKPFKSDTIDKATQEILSKKIETGRPVSRPPEERVYTKKTLDWSRWYGGIGLGIGIPSAAEETEYKTGYTLKLSTGVLLGGYLEIDLSSEFGWYKGDAIFDHETIIYRTSGDVDSIFQIRSNPRMNVGSFGLGVRYVGYFGGFTSSDYFQWGFGGAFQYIRFSESIDIIERTFRNSAFLNEFTYSPERYFWKPGVNINGMLSYVPSYESGWWLELSIGTSIIFYSPTQQQPYSMDLIDYETIYNIGLAVKFKLFDFTE